jgi:NIPSNAP
VDADLTERCLVITSFIRYTIDPEKLGDFEHYARVWMRLIEKYGGTHHGYFVPDKQAPPATFSFPGIAEAGPDNVGIALFSFPNHEAYETYRRDVAQDPECLAVTAHKERTQCFTKYERTFVTRVGVRDEDESINPQVRAPGNIAGES